MKDPTTRPVRGMVYGFCHHEKVYHEGTSIPMDLAKVSVSRAIAAPGIFRRSHCLGPTVSTFFPALMSMDLKPPNTLTPLTLYQCEQRRSVSHTA